MSKLTVRTKMSGQPIKPLHAVNGGPLTYNLTIDTSEHFTDAGIPWQEKRTLRLVQHY